MREEFLEQQEEGVCLEVHEKYRSMIAEIILAPRNCGPDDRVWTNLIANSWYLAVWSTNPDLCKKQLV